MDWSNETYVRLYTRDTPEWLVLPWQSRALFPLLLRVAERSGVIATKLGSRGISVLVGLPQEVTDAGLTGLLEDGCVCSHDLGYLIPNFVEAQESSRSDALRQRESRRRRKDVTKRDGVSQNVTECHNQSRPVTTSHDPSLSLSSAPSAPSEKKESETPELLQRREFQRSLWFLLEEERKRVSQALSEPYKPLLPFDPGKADLNRAFMETSSTDEARALFEGAVNAIAVAGREAEVLLKSTVWLTGAVFSHKNLRRLATMEVDSVGPKQGSGGIRPVTPL